MVPTQKSNKELNITFKPQISPHNPSNESPSVSSNSTPRNNILKRKTSIPPEIPPRINIGYNAPTYEGRVRWLEKVLFAPTSSDIIPKDQVLGLLFRYGVPDKPQLRSICWKLLLGALPWDRSLWSEALHKQRNEYAEFMKLLTTDPYVDDGADPLGISSTPSTSTIGSLSLDTETKANSPQIQVLPSLMSPMSPVSPHGLTQEEFSKLKTVPEEELKRDSRWVEYFKDEEIRHEIDKDIRRTHSTLHFFQLAAHPTDQEKIQQEKLEKEAKAKKLKSNGLFGSTDKNKSEGLFGASLADTNDFSVFEETPNSPNLGEILSNNHSHSQNSSHSTSSRETSPTDDLEVVNDVQDNSTTVFPPPNSSNTFTSASASDSLPTHSLQALSIDSSEDFVDDVMHDERFTMSFGQKSVHVEEVTTARKITYHSDILSRLLFVFAKLNPGIRYVQGMNEILAPIYYVFASSPDVLSTYSGVACGETPAPGQRICSDAEADAFTCFMSLMAELRDRFLKSMDSTETGIMAHVKQLNDILKDVDVELWQHLEDEEVDPRFYSFRWLTLLMSQEFNLPDVLRLWDSFFSDVTRFEFQLYFCVAMVIYLRNELLEADFAECVRLLQNYPFVDLQELFVIACDIRFCHANGKKSKFTGVIENDQSSVEIKIASLKSSLSSFWKETKENFKF